VLEDTLHGILAARHQVRDLWRGLTTLGEQDHLIARARLLIACLFVAPAQFRLYLGS
jgi:hypothetical protein